jgi:anti-anti-sigma factor
LDLLNLIVETSKMEISVQNESDYFLVKLQGNFDSSETAKLRQELLPIVQTEGNNMLVDLSGLAYVMSEGLGQFVNLVVESRKASSRVVFFSPTPLVETVIRASNLNKLFTMTNTRSEAIEALKGSSDA